MAQLHVVNEFQDVEGTADILQFPQRFFGLVLPLIAGEFAHNGGLRHLLLSQGGQDALEVGPLPFDQLHIHMVRDVWSDARADDLNFDVEETT